MQGQTIITTHDVDELFISTVVRLIQRRAFPNLRNIIAKTQLQAIAALAAFIPIVMGMGGNIGTQSSTIIVR